MKKSLFLSLVFVAVCFAVPASAQFTGDGTRHPVLNQDIQDPCPTYDACTMYHYSTILNQWNVTACKSPTGCRTCDNINRCRTVYLNAFCQCTDTPLPNSPGLTTCTGMVGSCVN